MTALPLSHRSGRLLCGLLAFLVAVGTAPLLTADLAAQDGGQKKKKAEEEEEPTIPKKKSQRKEEMEDDAPRKPKRKVIVDDEKEEAPAKPGRKGAVADEDLPPDLPTALKQTRNPDLQKLYGDLVTPHDVIIQATRSGQPYNVDPIKTYYPGENPQFRGNVLTVKYFDSDWKLRNELGFRSQQVLRIIPYEVLVIDRVTEFLNQKLDRLPDTSKRYLSRPGMLQAAVLVLTAAENFHLSAIERGVRQGDEWTEVTRRLHRKLLEVKLEQLATFVSDNDWEGASDHARRMAEAFPDKEEQELIAAQLVRLIAQGLQGEGDGRFKVARERLRLLERYFPGSRATRTIADGLRKQAETLFARAEEVRKLGDSQKALDLMYLAEEIYPRLEGLGDELSRLKKSYTILRVGVRSLPTNLLPGLAATDVDRMATELMFEGLVRLREEPGVGPRYEPVLAASLPRLVPLGREFRLARNAYWSNGEPVTAADVEATIRLLNQPERWEGAIPSLGKLLADRVDLGGDVLRVRLDLKQGYLDPLSLMTFKVLPRGVEAERVKFNREAPVGSGPFRYGGAPKSLNGRLTTRFLANPHYGVREGRFGLPRIREIQFVEYPREGEHPVDGLLTVNGNTDGVHFVADVPAGRAKDLKENHLRTLNVVGPLKTRRVWFLAVNHRRPPLQANDDLRLAIAHAIHREEILDKCFRGGLGKEVHQSLNGPFPAGSWACNPNLGSLHQPERARGLIKTAQAKGGGPPWKLFLKYPTGDPAVKQAVEMLCQQVAETIQVELIPSPVPPQKLREDVERSHDYELAYYYHDFPSEAYWLAPLFDPNSMDSGGTNYLGYADPDLNAQLQAATNVRDFEKVQSAIHVAHRVIVQRMPVIPLWQLDTFIAYRKGVRPTALDPLLGFSDVEQWTRED